MPNERVSQMVELGASEIASNDLFLITDTSAIESKKLRIDSLLLYIETSGSFNAINSNNAATASYILGTGVHGTVASASLAQLALNAISSSFATRALTASFALTASSIPPVTSAATASFLLFSGFPNGTASFALTSSISNNSLNAVNLIYTGTPNGTASFAISSSQAKNALTASTVTGNFSASVAISSSYAFLSSTASYAFNGVVNYYSFLSFLAQLGTGTTITSPANINNLSASVFPTSVNSHYLINMSVVVGDGNTGGDTCVALWRSSSLGDQALVPKIGTFSSDSGASNQGLSIISLTYIDTPQFDPGSTIIYRAKVFNNGGVYYVNRSSDNTTNGTSSMSVLEFVL